MGKIVSTGKPAIGGPWSLVDLDGNLVTNKSFEGKWTLLYFGFARCPDICPSEMVKVGRVMDILKKEHPQLHKNIQPIFVSIDPARDSLTALRDYAKDFHPSYVFLTGAPQQVQAMAKKYRVYMSKADETEDGDYLVDHSIVIYFHDETGKCRLSAWLFRNPVVRQGRALGGPGLSGPRPGAVSRMHLRALGGGGGTACTGWRGVFPVRILPRRRGGVPPTGVERPSLGLGSASSAGA